MPVAKLRPISRHVAAVDLHGRFQVAVFLVQNGVLTARAGADAGLKTLIDADIPIRADSFSLQERGIPGDGLAPGVCSASLDLVIDEMAGGVKVIWH